ncbi:hypothetical protein D3C72_1102350 [compost metagenome]
MVVGEHGDLGAVARIAGTGLDFHQALADFRHFQLEQLDHEFRRGAADEQLRATRLRTHFGQVTADAVAGTQDITRNALVLRNETFSVAAKVDIDVAALGALDHTSDQLAHTVGPRIDNLLALGFAHALHDHLLGGLGGDATEVGVLDLLFDVIADVHAFGFVDRVHQADLAIRRFHHHVIGHHFPAAVGFVVAILVVDDHAGQHFLVGIALLRCRGQRGLDGIEDYFTRHALLVGDRVHYQQQFLAHWLTPRAASLPPARWKKNSCSASDASVPDRSACSGPAPAPPSQA